MNEFILNYLLRVAHIGGMLGLSHKTIIDYQAGTITSDNGFLYLILGLITIISGNTTIYHRFPLNVHIKTRTYGR
jgi:hypothetical protein